MMKKKNYQKLPNVYLKMKEDNMIKEQDTVFNKQHFEKSENFKNLFKKKNEYFLEKIFPEYGHLEKLSFMRKSKIDINTCWDMMIMMLGTLIVISSLFIMNFSFWVSLYLLISGFIIMLSPLTFTVEKITSKWWFRKKKNQDLLAHKMFLDSCPDKELLKCFIETYGEEEFINIMLGKESLKYKDVIEYMDNKKSEVSGKKERLMLAETAKCLLQ